ncbi:uncharacterized protein J4E92_003273 [Alternaria infectoria]|uniref:uncharacterized protein n=1 Tax=Alternaria infectoria TaxID=45303 RepID=UPI00221E394D|nr:uncharacterized protein J4E92_003273 [Alternaria infectoria]KAI4933605.1 hypothetical protein J4E92_003273 [Alternaria infectoria]
MPDYVFAYRGLFKMAKSISHATRSSAFTSGIVVWLRTYLKTGLVSCANKKPEVSQTETGEQEIDFWKFFLFARN